MSGNGVIAASSLAQTCGENAGMEQSACPQERTASINQRDTRRVAWSCGQRTESSHNAHRREPLKDAATVQEQDAQRPALVIENPSAYAQT
jgi:hypothetical protein